MKHHSQGDPIERRSDLCRMEGTEEPDSCPFDIVPRGTETILIADDESAVRDVIRQVLLWAGYQVLEAVDGEEAVRVMAQHTEQIQLAIVDIEMPKLDGLRVLGQLREKRSDLKIILSSGYIPSEQLERLQSEPNLWFLAKPFSLCHLASFIRERLDA